MIQCFHQIRDLITTEGGRFFRDNFLDKIFEADFLQGTIDPSSGATTGHAFYYIPIIRSKIDNDVQDNVVT